MTHSPSDLIVRTFESFDDASESWKQFEAQGDHHGVQRHAWLKHWYDSVGHRYFKRLCILRVDHASAGPLLLMPLGIRSGAASCLTWLGGDITDYHAPLLGESCSRVLGESEFPAIWNEARKALPPHDVVLFDKQPERIGEQANPLLGLPGTTAHDVNFWSRLEGDWPSFFAQQVKSRLRGDSRRKRKRLAELGELTFSVARTPEQMRSVAETMILQKKNRYVATGTYSLFNDDNYRGFFLAPSRELLRSGMLHASELSLDGRALATHWGLVFRGRFYFIMAGFAGGEWMRYSPGRLLLEDLFRWCFDNGVGEFDFTIGEEPFKKTWANRASRLFHHGESMNVRGAALLAAERAKHEVRRRPALHRLISRIRNVIRR